MGEKPSLRSIQVIRTVKKGGFIHTDGEMALHRAVFTLLLLLGLAFLFYSNFGHLSQYKGKLSFSSFFPFSEEAERYMDRQLQDGAKNTELNALRTQLENKKLVPPLDKDQVGRLQRYQHDVYHGFTREIPEDHANRVYDDTSRADVYEHRGHPEARIETLIFRRKFIEEYDRAQRIRYVRQFLKNAEEQGYLVQLNDNLEVVQVRKIPTDRLLRLPRVEGGSSRNSRPSVFDLGYSGSF